MFDEIKALIEQFKAANDDRWKGMQDQLDQLQATENRRGLYGGGSSSKQNSEHQAAFRSFVTKGIDDSLRGLEITAGLRSDSDPDGGFMVPSVIDTEIEKTLLYSSAMRQIANVIPITTPNYKKLVSTAGVASGWVGETDARPETEAQKLAALTPYMGEIYANPAATQTMLDDSAFDVESFLIEGIGDEFALQEGVAFITGDGLLKPKGLLTYPTALTADATRPFGTIQHLVTGEAAAFKTPSATVSPADVLIDMIYCLKQGYRKGACWLMNGKTLATVSKFKDAVNGELIWRPALNEGQPSTLLGYAVYEDENMPDVGAGAFPIAFGNFKRAYTIVDRIGIRVLRDPYSSKPNVAFYATKRIGSFLNNSAAVKLLKVSA